MGKPSIFSKDYERKMKKRRKRLLIIFVCILVIVGGLVVNFNINPINFTAIKEKLQAWVDSDKTPEELEEEVAPEENIPIEEPKKEIEFILSEGVVLKCEYEEIEGVKKFKTIGELEGYTLDISPSKEQLVILDPSQEMYLVNISGEIANITKRSYISTKNVEFKKENIISGRADYIWHKGARFIDEDNIAYVTYLPYISNTTTDQYIWIYNVKDGSEKRIFKSKGKDISLGAIVPEKGIEVTIDGVPKILNIEGNFVQ